MYIYIVLCETVTGMKLISFKRLKFEYRITVAYLLIGGIWILFSDKILYLLVEREDLIQHLQTYKGWFYVTVTGVLFFIFIKKHLNNLRQTQAELKKHENNLQHLVDEKTKVLDTLNKELNSAVTELHNKNELINKQNSELRKTVETLQETQSQLIQAEKMASLGTLTAGVAHEINNPLNFIKVAHSGMENYFQTFGSKNEEETAFLLSSMNEGIQRTTEIVSGLNQFSRDNSKYDERIDIHSVVENCLLILQNQTKHKIEIIKKYTDDPVWIFGNSGKLHQVFINILTNAIQSIIKNGEIVIETKATDMNITISISDNGCGISEEHLSQITTPFFTTKPPGKGTGLGLSIAYTIIKEHKGDIHFESLIDKGTKVVISLPKPTVTDE